MVTSFDIADYLDRYGEFRDIAGWLRRYPVSSYEMSDIRSFQDVMSSGVWNIYFRRGEALDMYMRLAEYKAMMIKLIDLYNPN